MDTLFATYFLTVFTRLSIISKLWSINRLGSLLAKTKKFHSKDCVCFVGAVEDYNQLGCKMTSTTMAV